MDALSDDYDPYPWATDRERNALSLAMLYQQQRRLMGGGFTGYLVFGAPLEKTTEKVRDHGTFKVFCGVADWLQEKGLYISGKLRPWQDYIRYVFQHFEGGFPFPAQLKNPVLLKNFFLDCKENTDADALSGSDLASEYRKALPYWITENHGLLKALGLDRVLSDSDDEQ